MSSEDLVWYASYGSNLSLARFMCYIQGGKPEGSDNVDEGCRDKTPPMASDKIKMKHLLYFTGHSNRWGGTSGAFVNLPEETSEESFTLGRMYLITKGQFVDVVKQENRGVDVPEIDFDLVIKKQRLDILEQSFYGTIIYLDSSKGIPIFTFTRSKEMDKYDLRKPSEAYLRMICGGLRETWHLTDAEAAEYLVGKPGIAGNYTQDQLVSLQRRG